MSGKKNDHCGIDIIFSLFYKEINFGRQESNSKFFLLYFTLKFNLRGKMACYNDLRPKADHKLKDYSLEFPKLTNKGRKRGQLSDHNPVWVEIVIDSSDLFLKGKLKELK